MIKELFVLEKIRDIVMHIVRSIIEEKEKERSLGKESFMIVLQCEGLCDVINILLNRGLVTVYHVQKIVLNGIVLSDKTTVR